MPKCSVNFGKLHLFFFSECPGLMSATDAAYPRLPFGKFPHMWFIQVILNFKDLKVPSYFLPVAL